MTAGRPPCWQCPDVIAHILVDISRDLAHGRRRALRLQRAGRAVTLVGPVVDNVALIDVGGPGELCATWADINIALPIEHKVCPTPEHAARSCDLPAISAA